MTITTQEVREMAERLRRVAVFDDFPSNMPLGTEAAEMLLALVEERDKLAEANAKKADDIVTLGQLVGKAEARAEAAEADARRWRALRNFPGVCMTLSRNEDHTPNYMTAAEWIERGMNSEDFEDVEAAEIERMKETDTIWRFQVYPDTPVGFYVWHGATADYVLDAALQGRDGDADV